MAYHRLNSLEPDMVPGRPNVSQVKARWDLYPTSYSTKLVADYRYGVSHGRYRKDSSG